MAEKGFIRRHPKLSAAVAAGGAALVLIMGHNNSPHDNTPPNGKDGTSKEWTNTNPHSSHLACQLVLRAAGANYALHTAITEGTPSAHDMLSYSPKYQAGLSGHFENHRTNPVAIPWQQEVTIPGVDQHQPLASVQGSIGNTKCAPAIAGEN